MVVLLSRRIHFPPPESANSDGVVAVGGDLRPERVLLAYQSGIFPWPLDDGFLAWFSPDPRAILELDGLHVSRSLQKTLRRGHFEVRVNSAFAEVMAACAEPTDDRPSTWILPDMIRTYVELHRRGFAHSVESWRDGRLVGGLYGVSIGGLFAGESMFARESDASKVALVALVERMRARGLTLLDVQVPNPHLVRLGCRLIPRTQYLARLRAALATPVEFGDRG